MKRHYANFAEFPPDLSPRQVWRGGVRLPDPPVARRRVADPASDLFEDAFAELLANEPPGCQGLVLAY